MAGGAIFVDADALVPILSCDFVLTAAELGLAEVVVSANVLEEVERNLIENFPELDSDRLRRRVADMRDFFGDQIVTLDVATQESWADRINAKDRHVVAALLEAEASVLVTNDRRLRTEVDRARLTVTALSVDDRGTRDFRRTSEP